MGMYFIQIYIDLKIETEEDNQSLTPLTVFVCSAFYVVIVGEIFILDFIIHMINDGGP